MSAEYIDQGGAIRANEDLNMENLRPWLDANIPGLEGEPEVTQYSGGASNWTYRLKFDNQDLILRRPPDGTKSSSAHNMEREYNLQKGIAPFFPYVPKMYAYCGDHSIIGQEFYVMERLEGVIPRRNFPKGYEVSPEDARALCHNALDALITLHSIDIEANKLDWIGAGAGYARRQIEGWNRRYSDARTWNVPRGKKIMSWLEANIPQNELICMTHNDFRLDNLVLDPENPAKILGILDWELATLGDPYMDLGNMLAYWVEASEGKIWQYTRRQPSSIKGMLTRQEIIDYYASKTGLEVKDFAFYEVYGLFRLSVIAQQIYYRYYHKQTRNPEYKHIWFYVHMLHRKCHKIIKNSV